MTASNDFQDWVHQSWSLREQTQLIILWGHLVFPLVHQSIAKGLKPTIDITKLANDFSDYFSERDLKETLRKYCSYDYIRFQSETEIVAGTKLFCAFDAKKLYEMYEQQQKRTNLQ
ncbi:hypothetical protein [Risungbinella massiliensis]|uniref:hypothetical protein n=1 Tax=Risungbinella massiliensis TaxID=1329796 RepID=UPI0005CBF571|nr:hypothetical protein [Risungbinella massiliensis]